jgi:putative DNA primase/helicase
VTARAVDVIVDALRDANKVVKDCGGDRWEAQCPAHDDTNPSLSIKQRNDGAGAVVHCHVGCDYTDVLAALGLTPRDLFDAPAQRAAFADRNTYSYPDGRTVHRGRDANGKTFRQSGNTMGAALFHADEVTADTEYVYVPEGEKDVLAIEAEGAVAVCSAMGAGKARKFDWSPLSGKHVIVVADRDGPGRKHASQIAEILLSKAASVKIVEAAAGKDTADHLANGYALDDLVPITLDEPGQLPEDDVESATDDHHGPTGTEGFLTDSNISELLVNRVLRGKYHWANGLGWMRFDGKKWTQTTDYDVIEQSRRFATDLVAKVAAGGDADNIRKYTRRLSAGAVRAAADLAKGQLLIDGSAFDRHPDLLNVANGVVDLRTGNLGPHDPDLLLTKCAPTDYRPGAQHRDWTAALAALPADAANWMQIRLGQAVTGHPTPDDMLPVLHGAGSNGKTTLTIGVVKTLGEHAVSVPERVLLANPSDHPTELMTLRGARLALLEETPEARHLNVKRLKDTVGTPQMSARHIRQDTVTWDATHSLFVSTNYRPRVDETDHGTWRRLALVTFPYTYRRQGEELRGPDDRQGDPTLRERIKLGRKQHQAILAWLVEGAQRWYAAGQMMETPPPSVVADTRQWRQESDLILRFFDDNLIADPSYYVPRTDMYAFFTEWLTASGHQKMSLETFSGRFGQHDEITGTGIVNDRIRRSAKGLTADRKQTFEALPERFRAWIGVRYRNADDDRDDPAEQGKHDSGTGGTTHSGSPLEKTLTRDHWNGLSHLSQHGPATAETANAATDQTTTATIPRPQGSDVRFRPPAGDGRCEACGWHVATMGHDDTCPANTKGTEPVTTPQLTKLSIIRLQSYASDDAGRAEWFKCVGQYIGRVVSTNKALTKAEASRLIDALENGGGK